MAEKAGYSILRLPLYRSLLNPIEMARALFVCLYK